jgi:hypothetical protein
MLDQVSWSTGRSRTLLIAKCRSPRARRSAELVGAADDDAVQVADGRERRLVELLGGDLRDAGL